MGQPLTIPNSGIWPGLLRLVDDHPDPEGLHAHGLVPVAAAHWHESGRAVWPELDAERYGAVAALMEAEQLVARLACTIDEPFLVLKGPEVAAHYPDPTLRVLRDVDVLVRDADRVHDRLLATGWHEDTRPGVLRWYDDIHQTHPLVLPGMTVPLELHRRPNWPTWGTPPDFDELLAASRCSATGIDSARAPSTEHQALLVLAHAWARQPFAQLSQLVDVAVLVEASDPTTLRSSARGWKLDRLLDVALRTIDSVLLGRGEDPVVIRWCAPHLRTVRRVSHAREQLDRYAASFFVSSPHDAVRAAVEGAARRVRTLGRGALARP